MVYGQFDEFAVFIDIHRGRLTSGADHDDTVGAFGHMKIHQLAQGIEIEAAILVHGGNDGNNGTGNHGHSDPIKKLVDSN